MTFAICWFAARELRREEVRARALELTRLYGVAEDALSLAELPGPGVVVGAIGLDGPAARLDGSVAWGSDHHLDPTGDDDALRRWSGPGAAASWDDEALTLLTAAVDVASLYEAGGRAWSTHAAAAALLAHGRIAVRPDALPELLAFGHPVRGGTLVAGVRAVPAATRIVVRGRDVRRGAWWPRAERWALPPQEQAAQAAARAVEQHLAARAGEGETFLGLSAGLDSRVAAVALRRAGVPYTAFTWGAEGDADVTGAREVAAALGVEHRVVGATWLDDEEALARSVLDARRSDGTAPFGFAAPSDALPPGVATFSGMGGELGRAFHYAYLARSRRDPTPAQVRRAWRPERALPEGAPAGPVVAAADAAVAAAASLPGVSGWRALDLVYADQRMRLWGRTAIRATAGTLVPVFLEPRVAAALVGLPLEDRLTDGFHRRYLAEHAPDLAHLPLPPVRGQRAGIPGPVRRMAQALRSLRRSGGPASATATPLLDGRPATASHLHEVLTAPLVAEGLGEQAAARLRDGLGAGDPRAVEAALLLAAPVALQP